MNEELTAFALVVGTVTDAVAATPASLRSQLRIDVAGIGTPPVASDAVWARAYSEDGFVIGADAAAIRLVDASSSGADPKQLAGAFDVHFTLSAFGYVADAVTLACSHDALPIVRTFSLAPLPFAVRGRVTTGDPAVAVAGATVTLTASTPAVALPGPAITRADGTYAFASIPAVRSLTLAASGSTQTIQTSTPGPVISVNFSV